MPNAFAGFFGYAQKMNQVASQRSPNDIFVGQPMNVYLAESKKNIRFGLNVLLGELPDLKIIGESADPEDILSQKKDPGPDLMIMSWDIPSHGIEDILKKIRNTYPGLLVIALSTNANLRDKALKSGVNEFIYKGDPPERLIASIIHLQKLKI